MFFHNRQDAASPVPAPRTDENLTLSPLEPEEPKRRPPLSENTKVAIAVGVIMTFIVLTNAVMIFMINRSR